MTDYTNIRITIKVRDELKRIGQKGETYDEIILRLLQACKELPLQEASPSSSHSTKKEEFMRDKEGKIITVGDMLGMTRPFKLPKMGLEELDEDTPEQ